VCAWVYVCVCMYVPMIEASGPGCASSVSYTLRHLSSGKGESRGVAYRHICVCMCMCVQMYVSDTPA